MCDKHKPIIIYDTGGTQIMCEKCGKPLSEWKRNDNGKKHQHETKTKK